MPSPLITLPGRTALLAPQYFGSTAYYACMAAYGRVVIDAGMRYDKRFKSAHRCLIADTRGPLTLTAPVDKASLASPGRHPSWGDVAVSSHGQWWSDHIVSLESAYGRTPFFEFYFDRFRPFIADRRVPVAQLDCELDAAARAILGLETEVTVSAAGDPALACAGPVDDLRRGLPPMAKAVPYYQVRADKLGFIPGLSILDLIFNMGPEAPLVLRQMLS